MKTQIAQKVQELLELQSIHKREQLTTAKDITLGCLTNHGEIFTIFKRIKELKVVTWKEYDDEESKDLIFIDFDGFTVCIDRKKNIFLNDAPFYYDTNTMNIFGRANIYVNNYIFLGALKGFIYTLHSNLDEMDGGDTWISPDLMSEILGEVEI